MHGHTWYARTMNRISNALYRRLARRYMPEIAAFLAMGQKGCEAYADLGFDREILFPFMYAPYEAGARPGVGTRTHLPVRLIYVGRLDARAKGVDVLLQSVELLDPELPWTLDIVGGYGDMRDIVAAYASKHPLVTYLGPWQPNDVVPRMTSYDICVVPSRYDGWNVVVNHAINAGIALVVSDEATSDELVRRGETGRIVPAGNSSRLAECLTQLINDPSQIAVFKSNSARFSHNISAESVARYLQEVLDFTYCRGESHSRPLCPWHQKAS